MIPVSQIERIDAEIAVNLILLFGHCYTIFIKKRDGRKLAAAWRVPFPAPEFAIWLAAEMWRCVAEKALPQEQAQIPCDDCSCVPHRDLLPQNLH